MLVARSCPFTGVVNLFAGSDPHLAIGSLVRADATTCHWRCYVGPAAGGAAPDMRSAERQLVRRYRQVLRASVSARRRAGEHRRHAAPALLARLA
jgi:hypothetical protein